MTRFIEYMNESASSTTVLQESLHCVGLGISQIIRKNISENELLDGNLFDKSYNTYCKVDIGLMDLFNFAKENPSWVTSVINNTNALINSKYFKYNDYKFYRSLGVMREVYNTYKILSKRENVSINDDKWNPGDIWASKIQSIPEFEYLSDYNNFISDSLKKGILIGISLKKTKGTPKIDHIGSKSEWKPVSFKGIKKPASIFNTGISILTNNPNKSLNVRSFRTSKKASITTEIIMKDSSARHGKKTPTKWIKKYNIPQMSISSIQKYEDDTNYINNLILSLWKDCGYNFTKSQMEKDWKAREKKIDNLTGYYRSIINSLEFGAFLNKNQGIADDILNDIFKSASSISDISSDFIKVY